MGADTAQVTSAAQNTQLSYLIGGAGGIDARTIGGQDGDRSWTIIARAFTAVNAGLYTIVDCTGGDFEATVAEVVDKSPIMVQ
ncbi:hypothetical protein [uncultured Microbacterium sp.]|uniref:hypothetical protein n=1 Tax=uncultured Microbacterium sp. TaxID=191216 RepID=UPI00261DAA48|nr:hypothetical protein [uncultured Microbacterium sp.]